MGRPYTVELTQVAKRDLRNLDRATRHRIGAALDDLARQEDPYSRVKHLHGRRGVPSTPFGSATSGLS